MNKPTKPTGRESGISQNDISKIPAFSYRNRSRIDPDPSPFYIESTDSDVKPIIPLADRIQVDVHTPSPASSNKRGAKDPEDEVHKRVKASHTPPIPGSTSTCASRQIKYTDLEIPPFKSSEHTAQNVENENSMGHAIISPAPPLPAVPAIPIEGIETLQQASSDMLQALVKKDAVDREKRLMVAVGTIRTCLDIDFVPHMELWREDLRANKNLPRAPVLQDNGKHPVGVTSGPSSGTSTSSRTIDANGISDPLRHSLREELARTQATAQRQEETIIQKDTQLASSREENKRLANQLAKVKLQIEGLTKPAPPLKPDLENTIIALKKVINEKQGEIEKQKKSLQELEIRNAKLVRESIITPPATPIPPKVDPQVAALERTIQEQGGRIERQGTQFSNLERQNAKLKKNALDNRSQQSIGRLGQAGVGQGQARRARGGGGRKGAEPASGRKSGESDGQVQRQLPPHMSGTENDGARGSTDHSVKSNVIRWEDIPALYGGSSQQADPVAGSSTGSKPTTDVNIASKSRTGANRVNVNSRSLLDRMCRQPSDDEPRMIQERGSLEGQDTGRGGSWDREQTDGASVRSGGYERNSMEPDGGRGSDNPGGDGWGYSIPGHGVAGQVDTGEDIYVIAIPVEDDWNHSQIAREQWGHDDGGEHWDHYHAQAARSQPGSTSSSW